MTYSARKIKDTNLYHYTGRENHVVVAVGYCSSTVRCNRCYGWSAGIDRSILHCSCDNTGIIQKEACLGHGSPEDAHAHYLQYLLDGSWYNGNIEPGGNCEICKELTNILVTTGEDMKEMHILCEKHNNKESLAKVIRCTTSTK